MRIKQTIAILIAISFTFVAIASLIFLFTVKEVRVDFSVAEETETFEIQKKFNSFVGKSLPLIDLEQVENCIEDPSYEVVSVKKQFPNVINVKIKQRREIYKILKDGNIYTADQEGVVFLCEEYQGGEISSRETIEMDFENVLFDSPVLGQVVNFSNEKTFANVSDKDFFNSVLEMAKSASLTDFIKKIKVINVNSDSDPSVVSMRNVEFYTYTGVKILIEDAYDCGVERITAAINAYDSASDYIKTFNTIKAYKTQEGNIQVVFSQI